MILFIHTLHLEKWEILRKHTGTSWETLRIRGYFSIVPYFSQRFFSFWWNLFVNNLWHCGELSSISPAAARQVLHDPTMRNVWQLAALLTALLSGGLTTAGSPAVDTASCTAIPIEDIVTPNVSDNRYSLGITTSLIVSLIVINNVVDKQQHLHEVRW